MSGWLDRWATGSRLDEATLGALQTEFAPLGAIAAATADDEISAERLARQFDVIERRLDGQPARVLRFPTHTRLVRTQSPLRRWVATAAACGLVFGLAAGRLLGPDAPAERRHAATTWDSVGGRATQSSGPTLEPVAADDRLLGEVDAAIARTLHQEFRVLDELTPPVPGGRGRR